MAENAFGLYKEQNVAELFKGSWVIITKNSGFAVSGFVKEFLDGHYILMPFEKNSPTKDGTFERTIVREGRPRAEPAHDIIDIAPTSEEEMMLYFEITNEYNAREKILKDLEFKQRTGLSRGIPEHYTDGGGI